MGFRSWGLLGSRMSYRYTFNIQASQLSTYNKEDEHHEFRGPSVKEYVCHRSDGESP